MMVCVNANEGWHSLKNNNQKKREGGGERERKRERNGLSSCC